MVNRMFCSVLLFILVFPAVAVAHNGGRDELGGHFRNSDCEYALHEPTEIANQARNMDELIELIKKYNNNSACTQILDPSKVDLEGHSFSGAGGSSPEEASASPVSSSEKIELGKRYEAKLVDCTDGDTAVFNLNGQHYKTRFLYIDTPESTREVEPFGPQASKYTCSFLKKGTITLETDGGNLFDRYGRLLAWVWVGDKLLQEEITKAGLVKGYYDYGSYKYEDTIWAAMVHAKENGNGIYGEKKSTENEGSQPDVTEPSSRETQNEEGQPENSSEQKDIELPFNCSFLQGLIAAVAFFAIKPVKEVLRKRVFLAKWFWTRKWWLNLVLLFVYTYLCTVTFALLAAEIVLTFAAGKRTE